jgi:hypothetical protein
VTEEAGFDSSLRGAKRMSSDVDISPSPARASKRIVVALLVGLSFAFRSVLTVAQPNFWNASSLLDDVAIVSWSLALASLAGGAWLVATLATRRRAVTAAAVVLALGGLGAALANLMARVLWHYPPAKTVVARKRAEGQDLARSPAGPQAPPRSSCVPDPPGDRASAGPGAIRPRCSG